VNEVFVDAYYWIAMLNPNDRHHAAVMKASGTLKRRAVTTIWTLMETADALSAPSLRPRVHKFLTTLHTYPKLTVIADLEPWLSQGLALYGARPDKDWSLTGCISFEVMKSRGIAEALTGDRHFVQAGFVTLLAD